MSPRRSNKENNPTIASSKPRRANAGNITAAYKAQEAETAAKKKHDAVTKQKKAAEKRVKQVATASALKATDTSNAQDASVASRQALEAQLKAAQRM